MTKLFGQNTYLDLIPPFPPNTMLITAIIILIVKQHNDFYCKRYLPKSNIVEGGGAGGLFKIEICIEKSIVGTFL